MLQLCNPRGSVPPLPGFCHWKKSKHLMACVVGKHTVWDSHWGESFIQTEHVKKKKGPIFSFKIHFSSFGRCWKDLVLALKVCLSVSKELWKNGKIWHWYSPNNLYDADVLHLVKNLIWEAKLWVFLLSSSYVLCLLGNILMRAVFPPTGMYRSFLVWPFFIQWY